MKTAFVLIAALAAPAAADTMDALRAPHLAAMPRTDAEAARIKAVTAPPADFTKPEAFEGLPAGAATVRARNSADAFSQPSANIGFDGELNFKVGDGLFRKIWVSSPSSTLASDGLGPLYNARSCQRCHLKDGRGHPPGPGAGDAVSMFLRISVPAGPADVMTDIEAFLEEIDGPAPRTRPHPVYGGQMQDFALPGQAAEYALEVTYREIPVALAGGQIASLRAPTYGAGRLGHGPLGQGAMLSARVAPQMIGLGLLEAIDPADILGAEDPDDANGDGVSGRAQIVWSAQFQRPMLGRFGLKAGAPTIRHQSAEAFAGDIGISSPLFPAPWGDCTAAEIACRAAPHGDEDGPEVSAEGLDLVTFYARNLAVPARRNIADPQVLRGKQMFHNARCTACHTPKFVTQRLEDQPAQSFQLIWPFTDLLLHDMGEGLADHRPEGRATGREWRTAPLWGIGMTKRVSGHSFFLHDGRARNLTEAILWHAGEAGPMRDAFAAMAPDDRAALIRFLESL
jgi:CxxC motif-containing protein (DUF1111 family)